MAKSAKTVKKIKTSPVPKIAGTSPVPSTKIVMLNFYDALREVVEGKKVTRVSWNNVKIYVFIHKDFLSINKEDGIFALSVSKGDLDGIDWYSIPEDKPVTN